MLKKTKEEEHFSNNILDPEILLLEKPIEVHQVNGLAKSITLS